MDAGELLTLGLVAVRIGNGLMPHHVQRLCTRGAVPFQRAGRLRLIRAADLPAVRRAAEKAGYVSGAEVVANAAS